MLYAVTNHAEAKGFKVRPIIIDISNELMVGDCEKIKTEQAGMWLTELIAPGVTLLKSREAHGTSSQSLLRDYMATFENPDGRYMPFCLEKVADSPPLGWFLSEESRRSMDTQRRSARNERKIKELISALKGV